MTNHVAGKSDGGRRRIVHHNEFIGWSSLAKDAAYRLRQQIGSIAGRQDHSDRTRGQNALVPSHELGRYRSNGAKVTGVWNGATLVDAVEGTRDFDSPITIVDLGYRETRTRAEVLDRAAQIAGGLAQRGFGRGDRIAMAAKTSFDFITTSLGVWRMGGVVVPLPPELDVTRQASVHISSWDALEASGVDVVVTEGDRSSANSRIPVVNIAALSEADPYDGTALGPHDEAVLQRSSGTTGAAKGVILTHAAVTGYVASRATWLTRFVEPSSPSASWLPLYHDLGFVNYLVMPLITGSPMTLISPAAFVRRPLIWLEELARAQAANSAAPNFAFGLVARALEAVPRGTFDLSSWRFAALGGEPVHRVTVERFLAVARDHGFDPAALHAGYGLAEATCAVATSDRIWVDEVSLAEVVKGRATLRSSDDKTTEFVSVGRPMPGVEIRIVDSEGSPRADREIGEVQVRSPFLMKRYAHDAESPIQADGWLRTGDLGYVVHGELFITGRLKDLLIVHGKNYHPEDIERVVASVPGVKPGRCVAFGVSREGTDDLVIAFEPIDGSATTAENASATIARVVREVVGLSPRDVVALERRAIPKTSSGKLRRGEARAMYLEGRWQRLEPEQAVSVPSLRRKAGSRES